MHVKNELKLAGRVALGIGALTLGAMVATPASAVVYCKTMGVPKGCVVRPAPVVVAPRPVVVAPAPVVVAPRPVVVAPRPVVVAPRAVVGPAHRAPVGTRTNRGGPVDRVGRF